PRLARRHGDSRLERQPRGDRRPCVCPALDPSIICGGGVRRSRVPSLELRPDDVGARGDGGADSSSGGGGSLRGRADAQGDLGDVPGPQHLFESHEHVGSLFSRAGESRPFRFGWPAAV
ncbi:unnamed protein product, partial [Ectocarpus sp. 12 AP-2014]